MINVDLSTVYRMAEDGRLPAIKVGRQWRFPADRVAELLGVSPARTAPPAVPSSDRVRPRQGAPHRPAARPRGRPVDRRSDRRHVRCHGRHHRHGRHPLTAGGQPVRVLRVDRRPAGRGGRLPRRVAPVRGRATRRPAVRSHPSRLPVRADVRVGRPQAGRDDRDRRREAAGVATRGRSRPGAGRAARRPRRRGPRRRRSDLGARRRSAPTRAAPAPTLRRPRLAARLGPQPVAGRVGPPSRRPLPARRASRPPASRPPASRPQKGTEP